MVIFEAMQIGTKVANAIGVTKVATDVMPKLIPESASVATKICYHVAGAGVVGAILNESHKYFDGVFGDLEKIGLSQKTRPLVKEILKKESEEIVKANSKEEIATIMEKTNEEVKAVRQKVIEEAKAKKEEKEKTKEMKKNLGIGFYRKAGKRLQSIEAEDRK